MIIQIKGKVQFPITLDPSVWIFDDRKVLLADAFSEKLINEREQASKHIGEMFDQEIYFNTKIKPPVNKSIKRYEKDKLLSESYVIPLKPFLENATIAQAATEAILKTNEEDIVISIDQLLDSLVQFSKDGKPLFEDGPIYLYFGDGSNQTNPFKNIKSIIIQ